MNAEPNCDVAHLCHVELFTNKPEASLDFFVNIIGLSESGRDGGSVYLRAWDNYEFHTLKLTASHTTGIGHVGYRTSSEQALLRRASAIEAMGFGIDGSTVISDTAAPTAFAILTTTFSNSTSRPRSTLHRKRKNRP